MLDMETSEIIIITLTILFLVIFILSYASPALMLTRYRVRVSFRVYFSSIFFKREVFWSKRNKDIAKLLKTLQLLEYDDYYSELKDFLLANGDVGALNECIHFSQEKSVNLDLHTARTILLSGVNLKEIISDKKEGDTIGLKGSIY